MAKYII
ncbi:hypothetical protein ECPA5_4866, partial [Escherichia coli PA5]